MVIAGIEPLESRRQLTATVGLDPAFGTAYTPVQSSIIEPTHAVALPGGRVLVYGYTVPTSDTDGEHGVFTLYSRTGTLVSSFNHHHSLVQDAATVRTLGEVSELSALPDGSILVEADSGVHRLRLDGTFDPDFGNGGVLPKHTFSAQVQPDGTIRALQEVYDRSAGTYESRLITFSDEGRYLSASAVIAGKPQRLPDGRFYDASDDGTFTVYDAGLRPDPTFGADGTVSVKGAIDRWVAKHGPWYWGTQKLAKPQFSTRPAPLPLAGGGFGLGFTVYAGHSASGVLGQGWVNRFVRLDAHGGLISIDAAEDTAHAPGTGTTPTYDWTQGQETFRFQSGDAVAVPLPWTVGRIFVTARAADGSYYLVGQADPGNGSGLAVVHTLPVVGIIGGTAFGDTNANGKADPNETRAAGKVVYLDADNDGRLDAGETWTTTDAAGRYAFDDLGPGSYVVRRVLPAGYTLTTPATPLTLTAGQHATVLVGSRTVGGAAT